MKSLREIRDTTPAVVTGAKSRLPCGICSKATLSETLSQYGARCHECYVDYCRSASAPQPDIGNRKDGLLSWAHALKAREFAGDRLTAAQKAMWRSALGRHADIEAV